MDHLSRNPHRSFANRTTDAGVDNFRFMEKSPQPRKTSEQGSRQTFLGYESPMTQSGRNRRRMSGIVLLQNAIDLHPQPPCPKEANASTPRNRNAKPNTSRKAMRSEGSP